MRFVKTATSVTYEIFRRIRRDAAGYKDPTLVINVHPDVARLLTGDEKNELRHLMDRFNKSIQVKPQAGYHREQYDIYARSASGADYKLMSTPGPQPWRDANSGESGPHQMPHSHGGGGGGVVEVEEEGGVLLPEAIS